jgi:NAD(P)H-dependent flavin oxidoreductase YrpB (nitropropane dioxygenase family)
VGSADEARRALDDGADGLVAQGVEAGGHLAGTEPLSTLLPAVLELAQGRPVLAAGGVADASDVRRLLDAGATAAVAGTRFLLTEESLAHPAYKQRVIDADRTLVTLLFGFGWPMHHRVVPNAATDRWCADGDLAPGWVRGIGRATTLIGRATPLAATQRLGSLQRVALPFFSPGLPTADMPERSVDTLALYAGETQSRITDVVSAAEAVELLTP